MPSQIILLISAVAVMFQSSATFLIWHITTRLTVSRLKNAAELSAFFHKVIPVYETKIVRRVELATAKDMQKTIFGQSA